MGCPTTLYPTLFLAALISAAAAARADTTIEVFTVAGVPVTQVPTGTAVIELDAPGRLDAELSRELPADPDEAARLMQSRMRDPDWQDIADRYADRYVGLVRAWQLGVEKVPAVVIDGRYVIYGEPDVARALNLAQRHLDGEGAR